MSRFRKFYQDMNDNTRPNTPEHFLHLRDKFVTIVALGDSITEVNHNTMGGLNWVGLLGMGLQGRDVFPKGYTIINSGVGGDDMAKALLRLDRDVLRFHPDIVIMSFGMNDQNTSTPEEFRSRLGEAIAIIRVKTPSFIVLRTPNPMIDLGGGQEMESKLAAFSGVIREVATACDTLLVDHYGLWTQSMQSSCRRDMVQLMNDPAHPNAIGHRRFYHELAPVFNANRNFFYEWERILRDEGELV
jgi:lysophospholipase L1-like esterase